MPDQATDVNGRSKTEDRRGLECRHCGCKHFSRLLHAVRLGARILRRRECRNCGKRMTTWEKAGG